MLWKLQHNSDDCSLFQLNISYVARYMRAMKYWDTLARKHVNLRAPHQSIAAHSFYCQLSRVGNNQTFRLSGKHPNPKSIFCGPRKYPCPPEKGGGVVRNSKVKGGVSKAKLSKEKIWTKTGIPEWLGDGSNQKALRYAHQEPDQWFCWRLLGYVCSKIWPWHDREYIYFCFLTGTTVRRSRPKCSVSITDVLTFCHQWPKQLRKTGS